MSTITSRSRIKNTFAKLVLILVLLILLVV
jgi:hypothetical protein